MKAVALPHGVWILGGILTPECGGSIHKSHGHGQSGPLKADQSPPVSSLQLISRFLGSHSGRAPSPPDAQQLVFRDRSSLHLGDDFQPLWLIATNQPFLHDIGTESFRLLLFQTIFYHQAIESFLLTVVSTLLLFNARVALGLFNFCSVLISMVFIVSSAVTVAN